MLLLLLLLQHLKAQLKLLFFLAQLEISFSLLLLLQNELLQLQLPFRVAPCLLLQLLQLLQRRPMLEVDCYCCLLRIL